jgi:hypothetical protein
MKRDMDIIRKIILAVQEAPGPIFKVEGIDQTDFNYHVQLIDEAGLAVAVLSKGQMGIPNKAGIFRLTWAGHDFADSITDDTIWEKAKDNVIKPSASWSFGILLEYLKFEIKRHIPGMENLP